MSLFEDVINGENELFTESTDNEEVFTEAVYPDKIPHLKLSTKIVYLPIGKERSNMGNLCFLYTNSVDESIELMTNTSNFKSMKKYYYYYYNPVYIGKLYNKPYRFREVNQRKELYKKVRLNTNSVIHPYTKMNIDGKDLRNLFYDMSRYIQIYNTICSKLQVKKRVSLYWDYMKKIYLSPNLNNYEKKFVLINVDYFKMSRNLKENLNNPVFMLYYTLFRYPELISNLDMDFYMFTNNKILKLNPSLCDKKSYLKMKVEMKRLYSYVKDIDKVVDENEIATSEAIDDTTEKLNEAINQNKDDATEEITQDTNTSETQMSVFASPKVYNKIEAKVNKVKHELQKNIPDLSSVAAETIRKAVMTQVENDIDSDKELLDEIYKETIAPKTPKSAASTARDEELRKAQADIKIGGMSIKEIEKIQASHIPIPVHDVSSSVHTTNTNMTKLRFDNFDKAYNDTLMKKDITNAILSFNDKSLPLYVRGIEVADTSDELNYKETYTIHFEDANRKRHNIKVDIPKFIDDKFLYIGGNKKVIKKQNLFYPVVKTNSDIVQLTTNYNKMFIQRVGTKSISSVERMKTLIRKFDNVKTYFTFGNSLSINNKYITTIEYDELSKIATQFKNGKAIIFFDQAEAHKYADSKMINIPNHNMFIGMAKDGTPIYINNKTQRTADGKTIVEVILDNLPKDIVDGYNSIKAPNKLMYTRAKVMSQFISVGLLLGFWEGLTSILTKGKVKYRLEDKLPEIKPTENYLKFADCYLIYDANVGIDLLLNGFRLIDTYSYKISEMDTKEPYMPYLIKVYGKVAISNALMNVYEFTMDPITVEVCEDLNLPTDLVEIIIYAVSLLADSQYTPEINQGLSRIRSNEIIPAILYERLAKKYILYRNSNGRQKFSVPQDCVLKELIGLKTVEDYSTLNPVLELEMLRGLSSKGFRGTNLDESYTVAKRTFDPTSTGVISPSTSPDGSVGVNKTLTMDPSIISLRGYVDIKNDRPNELHDTSLFSPGELAIPLCATKDDPTRLGHALKQSKHVIPVKNSSPVLMSNGMEEVCRFQLSSDFAVNAKDNGEVVEYDEDTKIMIVKYNNGEYQAVNLSGTIVKNGGGGFFLSNQLITTLKVGDKFKKDDVLAYHKDFFTNDKFNNCRMNMGTLAKVAIMSTYNTYQDATMITEKLSDEAATEMCFLRQVTIGKNSNVEYIVKKGDEVKVGDSLIQFDTSYEDDSLNSLLANLSEDDQANILEDSKNDIHSKYSGVIEDIKIYSTVDLDELSPSLKKIVSSYYNQINKKKKLLEKYDPESSGSIVKCGMLLNESSKKIEPNKFGVIKGQKIEDGGVLIEFYVKHSEPLEIGSKIANFTALKNTIGEIIPAGYEPWSSFRPEEEISTIIASNSILKRMTPSILLTALGNKCIIELKNRLKEIYNEKE
jgi:hypothetical protein